MENLKKAWINLIWEGPIPYINFNVQDKLKSFPNLYKKGIYILCIYNEFSKEYLFTYVGSAEKGENANIYNRVNSWLNNKKCTFYKISKINNEICLDILNGAKYNDKIDENIRLESNNSIFVFFSVPDEKELEEIKNKINVVYPIRQIEGAIRHFFRQKMETRKYDITTENAGDKIQPFELNNILKNKSVRILGFS